jgi:hypothetical protein
MFRRHRVCDEREIEGSPRNGKQCEGMTALHGAHDRRHLFALFAQAKELRHPIGRFRREKCRIRAKEYPRPGCPASKDWDLADVPGSC